MFDYHGEMSRKLESIKELQCLNLLKTLEISMFFLYFYEFKIDYL
jgi:hypothetical protein